MTNMFITRKAIDRRTVLRGMGATLALPFLDAMVPALSGAPKPAMRFGTVYVPNGIVMEHWTPATEGSAYEFSPALRTLEPFRDRLHILTGLNCFTPPGFSHAHPGAATRFLTSVPPTPTRGAAEVHAGISIDQILSKELGRDTRLESLELALESSESAGTCFVGFACAYTNTITWRNATTPLPMEMDPRAVFERMFGDSSTTDPAVRRARMREDGSILDSVTAELNQLKSGLGSGDKAKLDEYFVAIRDVETRIRKAEADNLLQLPTIDHPVGVPDNFEEHTMLMYDLFALAYQVDITRVITFMIGREQSGRTFPTLGIPDAHHAISHHGQNPTNLAKLAKINAYHVSLFSRFVEKLRSTPDGDGSLLDHMMLLYGAGMSDGHGHDPLNLPVLLLGGGSGTLKSGRHIKFSKDTSLEKLHLTMLDKFGMHIDKLYDGPGTLGEL
jgi:hypothetical protein